MRAITLRTNWLRLQTLLCTLALLVSPLALYGQDDSPQESLDALMTKWAELDAELKSKEPELENADPAATQAYANLVAQADSQLDKIKSNILGSLENEPADKAKMRTILGIMINDATHGRDQEAQRVGDALVAKQVDPRYFEAAAKVERLNIAGRELFEEMTIRAREAKIDDLPQVKFTTSQGEIVLELFENQAPNTVANFIKLTKDKFYDGLKFHRVVEGFMAQGGDPNGDGSGGPGYQVKSEYVTPESRRHFFYSMSMANTGPPNTGGSQFFITFDRTANLNKRHTVFGRVISGHETLGKLTRTFAINNIGKEVAIPDSVADTIIKAEVVRDRGHEYTPEKVDDKPADAPKETPPSSHPDNDFGSDKDGSPKSK